MKSGNAAILRGGSESLHSSAAIAQCLKDGLRETGLPEGAIQPIPTQDRAAVEAMLRMSDLIDFIVPRGGRSLVERVMEETRIPVIAHLDGNCHVYLHADADRQMARDIVSNAKMRRTGICGAAESLVIDEASVSDLLPLIVDDLSAAGCEIRGDAAAQQSDARIVAASDDDWGAEYLDKIISVRVVDGLETAIDHINQYSSHHTDLDCDAGHGNCGTLPGEYRQRHRVAQCVDAICRWRRIWYGRRDRYRDGEVALPGVRLALNN